MERDAFFRDVIGQAPPPGLNADVATLTTSQANKFYPLPPFRKARLRYVAMKCEGSSGGGGYSFDLFP